MHSAEELDITEYELAAMLEVRQDLVDGAKFHMMCDCVYHKIVKIMERWRETRDVPFGVSDNIWWFGHPASDKAPDYDSITASMAIEAIDRFVDGNANTPWLVEVAA